MSRPNEIQTEPTNCVVCATDDAVTEAEGGDYLYGDPSQLYHFVACSQCGHLYLNPRPVIAEIGRIYPPQYPTFVGTFGSDGGMLARIKDRVLLRRFKAFAGDRADSFSLLDVGCGDGRFLLSLRRNFPKARLAALDWSFAPAVAAELRRASIQMFQGTIETASLPDSEFDMIVMNQLIEHVWDVPLTLRQCRAALVPGGLLAMETPNPGGWDRRFFRRGAWGAYYWPRHLNLFSRHHLGQLVTQADMTVDYTAWLLAPPCWISSLCFAAQRAGVPGKLAKRIFPEDSVFWMSVFTVIELAALIMGLETSNQKLVARRPVVA